MPQVSELVLQRFQELEDKVRAIRMDVSHSNSAFANPEQFYAWATSALAAIQGCFGTNSPHYTRFQEEMASIRDNYVPPRQFDSIRGIFLGAKSDVDGGYVFDLERSVSGEVFGDLVAAAKAALAEGHHTVATVLACAALEDALKRYASAQGVQVEGQTMETIVNSMVALESGSTRVRAYG